MLVFLGIVFKFSFYLLLFIAAYLALVAYRVIKLRKESKKFYMDKKVVSFLHPFCNDCGGGEKVLWMMVQALLEAGQTHKIKINILCGVKDDAKAIMANLKTRFEIDLSQGAGQLDIDLVRLKKANLLKPKGFLTMLIQIFGQIVFAFEILTKVHSDVIFDTTGLPFTYWILSLFGRSNVVAYVHYPFISADMISDIKNRVAGVHSRGFLSKLKFLTFLKVYYYKLIMAFYKWNGKFVTLQMCNSSWTYEHMKENWESVQRRMLYPPCATELYNSQNSPKSRENIIVSFAQFRPEKRHKMQVDIFQKVKENFNMQDLKMFIIGSIRHVDDQKLFDELQDYVNQKGLSKSIELCPNLSLNEVKQKFESAKVGLHTMRDEHFGISIIEMMASGLITVAHASAGPKHDIIGPSNLPVGFLANGKYLFYFR